LLPITLYTGYELTFIWFEFNRVFKSKLLLNYLQIKLELLQD
jgi:hypothetical protein